VPRARSPNSHPPMQLQPSILEKLERAHGLVAEVLGHAPQLYDCRLDQALLVLSLAIQRARRSPHLRWRLPPGYHEQELPFETHPR
jgi:hypothetical protein